MPNTTCISSGDTAWVLLSFILVLGMLPALALFEAGLLRSKNTLSLITQILSGLVLNCVLWDLFGYSLVYGPDKVYF
jgi:Amt family ammonium transporter